MFKKVLQTIAAAMTLCLTIHLAMASEIVKVPTAWLGEHEAFFDVVCQRKRLGC